MNQAHEASARALELERILMKLESAARYGSAVVTFDRRDDVASIAGVVRWFVKYLRQAIARSQVPLMVCSACLRITEDVASSPHVNGARCATCLGGALDTQIRELRAALDELERGQRALDVAVLEASEPRRLGNPS